MFSGTTHPIFMRFLNYRVFRGAGLKHKFMKTTLVQEILNDKIGINWWHHLSSKIKLENNGK